MPDTGLHAPGVTCDVGVRVLVEVLPAYFVRRRINAQRCGKLMGEAEQDDVPLASRTRPVNARYDRPPHNNERCQAEPGGGQLEPQVATDPAVQEQGEGHEERRKICEEVRSKTIADA